MQAKDTSSIYLIKFSTKNLSSKIIKNSSLLTVSLDWVKNLAKGFRNNKNVHTLTNIMIF